MEQNFDNMWNELKKNQIKDKEITPELKSDLIMAAKLNELIGDYDNAAVLYKQSGDEEKTTDTRILASDSSIKKEINLHLEKVIRKISRWLTVRQQWNKKEQQKAFGNIIAIEHSSDNKNVRDQRNYAKLDEFGSFDLQDEPEYVALVLEIENGGEHSREYYEKFDQLLQEQLGARKIKRKKMTDNPNERIPEGFEIVNYDGNSLILSGPKVQIWKTDQLEDDKN